MSESFQARSIPLQVVENTIQSGERFEYFHDGVIKTGFYDSVSKTFVGTVDGKVTTTIDDVSENYIKNLKSKKPE